MGTPSVIVGSSVPTADMWIFISHLEFCSHAGFRSGDWVPRLYDEGLLGVSAGL